jgi:hypothetical protein
MAESLMVAGLPEQRVIRPAHRLDVINVLAGGHSALGLTHHTDRVLYAIEPGVLCPAC